MANLSQRMRIRVMTYKELNELSSIDSYGPVKKTSKQNPRTILPVLIEKLSKEKRNMYARSC